MTRFLLDTNIVSDAVKPAPSDRLGTWMGQQRSLDLHISSWTMAEVMRGILQMPEGRKRQRLEAWLSGEEGLLALFAGRILPFDQKAAAIWAELVAEGYRVGRPRSEPDMIVAAIALANDCLLVTDNERHFAGVVPLLNPMR